MSQERLFAAFFFAVFLFLLYELYLFLSAFFGALVWAFILALTFYPLTARLVRLFRGSRGLAAFVLLLAILALAIVPAILLGSVVVREAAAAYLRLEELVRTGELPRLLDVMKASWLGALWTRATPLLDRFGVDVSDVLLRGTQWLSSQIVGRATDLAGNVLGTILNFLLMLVALFFFLRDGDRMAGAVRRLVPMDPDHTDAVFGRFYDTLTATVQSMILNAFAQGMLAGIGYWLIAGFSFSVFLGFVTGLASFLPAAGPAFVWGGAAVYLGLAGHTSQAIGLALWGGLVVSMVDNVIRPLFIGGRANLPTFLLLFSLLGGLKVYGFLGVFLGPVIVATLLAFVDIYRELYGPGAVHGIAD